MTTIATMMKWTCLVKLVLRALLTPRRLTPRRLYWDFTQTIPMIPTIPGCVRGQVHAFLSNKKIGLIDPGSKSF